MTGTNPSRAFLVGLMSVAFAGAAAPQAVAPRNASTVAPSSVPVLPPPGYPMGAAWRSAWDGFMAMFPSPPQRYEMSNLQIRSYSFQANFRFTDGDAVAAISVIPLPVEIPGGSQRVFLESAHKSFIQTLGAPPDSTTTEWVRFAPDLLALRYRYSLIGADVNLRGSGFWIVNARRAIRVSVRYPGTLSAGSASIASYFPSTFFLLTSSAPTIDSLAGDHLYRSSQFKFRIMFPSGWRVSVGDGQHIVQKATYQGATLLVMVMDIVDSSSLALMRSELGTRGKALSDAQVADEIRREVDGQNMTLSDYPAPAGRLAGNLGVLEHSLGKIDNRPAAFAHTRSTYTTAGATVKMESISWVLYYKGVVYTIQGAATIDDFARMKTTLERSIRTFVIEDW